MPPLALTRLNITKPEAGIVRVVSGAKVTVYETMPDGSSPVLEDGSVQVGAVKTTLYSDRGGVGIEDNPVTTDPQGLIEFYSLRGEVHLQIVSVDNTKFGIPWMSVGGFPAIEVGDGNVDLRDYSTLTAAIAALGTHKGIVHCPAGVYQGGSLKGAIKKNTIIPNTVTLKGDGYRNACTQFTLDDSDPNADWFTLSGAGGNKIEGIYFRGIRDSIGSGTGRLFIVNGCNGTLFKGVVMDQICGICVETIFDAAIDNVNLFLEDCIIQGAGSHGIKLIANSFGVKLHRTDIAVKSGHCIWAKGQSLALKGGAIEPNDDTTAAILIDGARQFDFDGTWFEYNSLYAAPANPPLGWFIELANSPAADAFGGSVRNCRFVRLSPSQSLRAMKSSGNYNWVMDNNVGIFENSVTIIGTDDVQTSAGDRVTFVTQHKRMRDNMSSVSNWTVAGAGTSTVIGL